MRIETQKQTLQARDESIKKLLEMLQSKGEGEEHMIFSKVDLRLSTHTSKANLDFSLSVVIEPLHAK